MILRRTRDFSEINGLSRRTGQGVRRLEADRFWPGFVADAITAYERFLHRPGRVLYPGPQEACPCCGLVEARDLLQDALDALPRDTRDLWAARGEVGCAIRATDSS